VFVPLWHPAGHGQAGFGEAVAVIGGMAQKVHLFLIDLPQKATLARWMCHALLVILALSGCTLPPLLTQEELAERWADRCAAWGIGTTSPDFERCLINQEILDELIRQRRPEWLD
jgi:hypothetical protein